MNLRKEKLAALIVENLSTISIKDDELIVIRLPAGVPSQTSQTIGQSIVDSLRALNKNNSVILLPYEIEIQKLDEQDMKKLGWIKDATSANSDTSDSRLLKPGTSNEVVSNIDEQRRIQRSEALKFLAEYHDLLASGSWPTEYSADFGN